MKLTVVVGCFEDLCEIILRVSTTSNSLIVAWNMWTIVNVHIFFFCTMDRQCYVFWLSLAHSLFVIVSVEINSNSSSSIMFIWVSRVRLLDDGIAKCKCQLESGFDGDCWCHAQFLDTNRSSNEARMRLVVKWSIRTSEPLYHFNNIIFL